MSFKCLTCLVALGAMASTAAALPSVSVIDSGSGSGKLQITVTGTGSIGAELTLQLAGATLTGATVNSAIFDTANPGDNPFIAGSPVGGDATGLDLDLGATNRLFAAYGSGSVAPGTYDFLTFTYTGSGTATGAGKVAQLSVLTSNLTSGAVAIGGTTINAADFNSDGNVDLLDLDILGMNFGQSPRTMAQGDANGDSTVNLLDLDILGANFGAAVATATAVPEPATALLGLGALAGVFAARRR